MGRYLTQFKHDFLYDTAPIAMLSYLETGLGLCAANIATLRPLFKSWQAKKTARTPRADNGVSNLPSNIRFLLSFNFVRDPLASFRRQSWRRQSWRRQSGNPHDRSAQAHLVDDGRGLSTIPTHEPSAYGEDSIDVVPSYIVSGAIDEKKNQTCVKVKEMQDIDPARDLP